MHRRHALVCVLSLLLGRAIPALAAAAVVHPTPEDVAALSAASSLALSPDGHRLAYALATQTLDPAAKPSDSDADAGWTRERQLWVVDVAGGTPHRLTSSKERAGSPAWSPDGRELAFLRKSGEHAAIHVLRMEGGEPEVIATGDRVPTSLRWSPDGRSLLFTASVPPTAAEKQAKWRSGGVVEWDAEWRSQQLWSVPRAGGEPRRITSGTEHVVEWALSPDGSQVFALTSASADPYQASSQVTPRILSARDGTVLRTLDREPRDCEHPRWSPDGRRVAWLACHQGLSQLNALMVCDVTTGATRDLSPSLDPTFATFEWTPDSRALVVAVEERTGTPLWRFPVEGGGHEDLGFSGRVIAGDLQISRDGARIVFPSSSDTEPTDPTAFEPATRSVRVIARLNPQVAGWRLGPTRVVRWAGPEGTALEGLLTVTPQARRGAAPPLVVMPHGGPDATSQRSFNSLAQFLAARGYSVFRPNYRGGLGYGHAFYAANRGRFGEIESMDIESGVDALIASGDADPRALFFGGWSWGGYISVWTLTHSTRYRAHVVGASVNDVVLSYGLSDINHGVAAQWEYQGDPWHQLDHFDRANPIRFVKSARSPTLIMQGEEDGRVPFQQSVLLYRALRDVGCPVTFYAYPREDHGFVEPAHVAHRLRAWADWYDHHRGGAAPASPAGRPAAATAGR